MPIAVSFGRARDGGRDEEAVRFQGFQMNDKSSSARRPIYSEFFRLVLSRFPFLHAKKPVTLNRSHYKSIWNSVSGSEQDAKLAVSGFVEEERYRESGEGTVAMLKQFTGITPDDVVLEIGAGVGRVGVVLAPICKEWIGVDVSENMLGHIERRLAGMANVRTVATNGFDLSGIPSESVNVVYSTVVFMHLDEWDRYGYIKEGFRVLKPGGRMLVDNVDLTSDLGWEFFEQHCAMPPHERPAQISKTSTPQELEAYFRRSGFEAIEQHRGGLWIITCGRKPV
jgi:SAM-dependent methyltransferase